MGKVPPSRATACCPARLGCSTHSRGAPLPRGPRPQLLARPSVRAKSRRFHCLLTNQGRASKVHRERCRGRRRRDGDVRQRDGGHVGEEPRQTAASLSGAMALLDEGHLEDHPGAQERGKADQGGCVGAAACSTRLLGIAPARLLRLVVMGGVHSQGGGEASPPGAQTHLACSSSRLRPGRPDTPRVLEQPPPKSQAGVGVIRYGRIVPTVQ